MPVANSPCDSIILEPRSGHSELSHSFLCNRIEPRRWKVQLIPMSERVAVGDNHYNTVFASGLKVLQGYEIGRSAVRFLDDLSRKVPGGRNGRAFQSPEMYIASEKSHFETAVEFKNSQSAFRHALRELEDEQVSYVVGIRGGVTNQEARREFLDELDEILSSAAVIGEDDYVDSENDTITLDDDLVLVTIRVDGQIEMQENDGKDEVLFGIRI